MAAKKKLVATAECGRTCTCDQCGYYPHCHWVRAGKVKK